MGVCIWNYYERIGIQRAVQRQLRRIRAGPPSSSVRLNLGSSFDIVQQGLEHKLNVHLRPPVQI